MNSKTKPFETDVFVVGGGPAGLAAAIAARQHGFKVLVADRAQPSIDKACGEGLMPDSLTALAKLGVKLEGIPTGCFHGIRFLSGDHSVSAKFPNGIGRGIRRTLLHSALVKRADQVGASMIWGARVEANRDRTVAVDGTAVRYRWLIGADGNDSRIRRIAGLENGVEFGRRIGIRRHFMIRPWSDLVEVHWGDDCQGYVTPIAENEICVALISRRPMRSFESALAQLPRLNRELRGITPHTATKGAITISRRLRSVTSACVALIGEASGSVDAITGEGLAMSFRQAEALGRALAADNLGEYEKEHRQLMRLPYFMGRTMLTMDKHSLLRHRAIRALASKPEIFDRMLSVHVGAVPFASLGLNTAASLSWQLLTA